MEAVAGSFAADKPVFGCFAAANPLDGWSRSLVSACTLLFCFFPIINWA